MAITRQSDPVLSATLSKREQKWSPLKSWAMLLLVMLSLAYLGHILYRQYLEVLDVIGQMNPWLLCLSVLPFSAMYLSKAVYHWLIVRQLGEARHHAWAVMTAYCQSQVVRYLPGKVWGLVYQANRLRQTVTPQNVVIANAVQLLNTQLYTACLCAAILLAYLMQQWAWLLVWPIGILFLGLLHHLAFIERASAWLIWRMTKTRLPPRLAATTPVTLWAVFLLSFEWVAFFVGWGLISESSLSIWSMIVLGASYSVAALMAAFAIVVPSGLAVREALFVSLGARLAFDVELLLVYGIVARVLLTVSELACVFLMPLLRQLARRRIR